MKWKGIFALDIDGTLTHRSDWIAPSLVAQLKLLVDQGWAVTFVTGRMFAYAQKILHFFPFPYLIAVQNGADIIQMPFGKSLRKNYLKGSILPSIEKAHEGIVEDLLLYSGFAKGDFCYYRPSRFSPHMEPYLSKLKSLVPSPWKACEGKELAQMFAPTEEFSLIKCFGLPAEMKKFYERLLPLREKKEIEVSLIKDPIDPSLLLNMITHPQANKGGIVHFLREHFQTAMVIGAGNDANDLKMLQEADIGIAVGKEAPEELKKEADILVDSVESLGIIAALEEAKERVSS